jgi:hypothetical protein
MDERGTLMGVEIGERERGKYCPEAPARNHKLANSRANNHGNGCLPGKVTAKVGLRSDNRARPQKLGYSRGNGARWEGPR